MTATTSAAATPAPPSWRIVPAAGHLPALQIESPLASALIYLHGAHIAHYQPAGQQPVLFMSERSWFEPGKPIRGGVPVIFPWFGARKDDPAAPGHGLVRLIEWKFADAQAQPDGSVVARFTLDSSTPGSRRLHAFELELAVHVGRELRILMTVTNTDGQPWSFEAALHSYFRVSDARCISIAGLEHANYIDTVGGQRTPCQQNADAIRITAETDRLYLDNTATCIVDDPAWERRITVAKTNARSTVVWNPWVDKSRKMPDFGDDEWPAMLCLETANVASDAITLPPGQRHSMAAVIRSDPY